MKLNLNGTEDFAVKFNYCLIGFSNRTPIVRLLRKRWFFGLFSTYSICILFVQRNLYRNYHAVLQQKYSIQFVQQNRPFEKDNIIYNSQRIERSEQQKDYYVIKFNMVT